MARCSPAGRRTCRRPTSETNLGEKGVWYWLVVGPPGSRDAAAACARSSRLPATAVAGLLRGDHRIGIRDTGTGLYIPMSGA